MFNMIALKPESNLPSSLWRSRPRLRTISLLLSIISISLLVGCTTPVDTAEPYPYYYGPYYDTGPYYYYWPYYDYNYYPYDWPYYYGPYAGSFSFSFGHGGHLGGRGGGHGHGGGHGGGGHGGGHH